MLKMNLPTERDNFFAESTFEETCSLFFKNSFTEISFLYHKIHPFEVYSFKWFLVYSQGSIPIKVNPHPLLPNPPGLGNC